MLVDKDDLHAAIEVLNLVPSRPGITSSEFIKISKTGDGIKMSLASEVLGTVLVKTKKKWPGPSPYFVDKRLVSPFILTGNGSKPFEFEMTEDKKGAVLNITHGRRQSTFAALPKVGGYSDVSVPESAKEIEFTDAQKVLISCALNWSTPDPVTPQLNCVYVTSKGLVLSYNQLAIFSGKTDKFTDSIPLPLFLLSLIADKRNPKIMLSKKQVVLVYKSGMIAQSLPLKAVAEFPVKDIMSSVKSAVGYPVQFSIPAGRLCKVLERFSAYIAEVRKKDRVIRLQKETDNTLSIETKLQHVSMYETLKVNGVITGKVKCDWALDLVLPIVKHLAMENTDIVVRYDDKKKTPYYLQASDVTLAIARKA